MYPEKKIEALLALDEDGKIEKVMRGKKDLPLN